MKDPDYKIEIQIKSISHNWKIRSQPSSKPLETHTYEGIRIWWWHPSTTCYREGMSCMPWEPPSSPSPPGSSTPSSSSTRQHSSAQVSTPACPASHVSKAPAGERIPPNWSKCCDLRTWDYPKLAFTTRKREEEGNLAEIRIKLGFFSHGTFDIRKRIRFRRDWADGGGLLGRIDVGFVRFWKRGVGLICSRIGVGRFNERAPIEVSSFLVFRSSFLFLWKL